MANRYIDTNFYRSPFVRSLKGSLKGLYCFIICDCSGAGIWIKDLKIASEYTGFNQTEKEFDEFFIQTGKAFDLGNGKYFFPDFIAHQYPKGFSLKNPAQINFIKELQKYNLLTNELTLNFETLQRPFNGSISNGNGIGNGKSDGNGNDQPTIPKPKLIYPYDSKEFMDMWELLLTKSKWKKKDFASLQASLKKLSKVDEPSAIAAIVDAISGDYQGIFPKQLTPQSTDNGDRKEELMKRILKTG